MGRPILDAIPGSQKWHSDDGRANTFRWSGKIHSYQSHRAGSSEGPYCRIYTTIRRGQRLRRFAGLGISRDIRNRLPVCTDPHGSPLRIRKDYARVRPTIRSTFRCSWGNWERIGIMTSRDVEYSDWRHTFIPFPFSPAFRSITRFYSLSLSFFSRSHPLLQI